jgi:hypothetical protein
MSEETPMKPPSGSSDPYFALSDAERLELALALVQRTDRYALGLERLKNLYPGAPERLLSSAAYHLYDAMATSFITSMAHVELSLRREDYRINEALVADPAYHLCNWLQLESLLPWSREVFHSELEYLKACIHDGDLEGARKMVEKVLDQFEGVSPAPSPDFPE